jgi:GTP-binding protein HflX
MLETTETLLPSSQSSSSRGKKLNVICVGLAGSSLDELDRLLTTLGVNPAARVVVAIKRIHPATYVGSGKVDEIKEAMIEAGAEAVIFDVELSPNQLRNLEAVIQKPILDRPGVIIEIFSQHARTKEAKTQVSLARLQYILPRLSHFWTHFERQRGGGSGNRGMGEKQIEVDRRLVKKRISVLKERLGAIEKERVVQRSSRKDVLKVALVGYTNAGKSTLLNALTQSNVLAENKLFATLDASVRTLDPHGHPPVVAIDTVGFIDRLPPSLVASFRSTLEELEEADLLVHVVDASSPQAREQLKITEKVLEELKVDTTPRITVLNKGDLVPEGAAGRNSVRLISPGSVSVSALNKEDMVRLRELILNHFRKNMEVWEVLVPYSDSKMEALIHAHGSVELNRHMEKGTFIRLRIGDGWAKKIGLTKYRI